MTVPDEIMKWSWTALIGLIGVVWKQLGNRLTAQDIAIKDLKHHVDDSISSVKVSCVHTEKCELKEQLATERMDHFEQRYQEMKDQNSKEHDKIFSALSDANSALTEIKICVSKLSTRRRSDRIENGLER